MIITDNRIKKNSGLTIKDVEVGQHFIYKNELWRKVFISYGAGNALHEKTTTFCKFNDEIIEFIVSTQLIIED